MGYFSHLSWLAGFLPSTVWISFLFVGFMTFRTPCHGKTSRVCWQIPRSQDSQQSTPSYSWPVTQFRNSLRRFRIATSQEWLQFRGFCKIGRASDYFALDNLCLGHFFFSGQFKSCFMFHLGYGFLWYMGVYSCIIFTSHFFPSSHCGKTLVLGSFDKNSHRFHAKT